MKLKVSVKAMLMLMLFSLSSAHAAKQTVDVLVLYNNEATTVTEGKDIPVTVAAFIENANQTYNNSEVNIKLRVVHLKKVAVSGTGNVSSTALKNLAKDLQVGQLREQYGADLVVLLTLRRNIGGGFVCGIGYVPQGVTGKFYSGAKFGGFSVSAVNCGNATFVHELGHNMGLGHSYVQGSKGGIYEWGRGHGKNNIFSTTMAYPQVFGSAVRVQQFSSPDQAKCFGLLCGVQRSQNDGADAVTSLNTTAKQVAEFFPTKVASTVVGQPNSPQPKVPANIVADGSFDALGSWKNFWGLSSLQLSTVKFLSKFGLKVSDRQFYYSGPVQTIPLKVGNTYQFSAHAALATPVDARDSLGAILLLNTANSGLQYQYLAGASVVRGQWSELNSNFTVTGAYGKVNSIDLLFYGPGKGIDFYLDEVAIKAK